MNPRLQLVKLSTKLSHFGQECMGEQSLRSTKRSETTIHWVAVTLIESPMVGLDHVTSQLKRRSRLQTERHIKTELRIGKDLPIMLVEGG